MCWPAIVVQGTTNSEGRSLRDLTDPPSGTRCAGRPGTTGVAWRHPVHHAGRHPPPLSAAPGLATSLKEGISGISTGKTTILMETHHSQYIVLFCVTPGVGVATPAIAPSLGMFAGRGYVVYVVSRPTPPSRGGRTFFAAGAWPSSKSPPISAAQGPDACRRQAGPEPLPRMSDRLQQK